MTGQGQTVERMAFVAAMLVRKPRETLELAELLGCKPDTMRLYLKAYTDEGLVRRLQRGRLGIYEWAA